MVDLFKDKAAQWDTMPIPAQISAGLHGALAQAAVLEEVEVAMDFGAGTGLVSAQVAPHVRKILAVDISEAMLSQLAQKPELAGKVEVHCQDILAQPLAQRVQLIVSAMAMHHVEDTAALMHAFAAHLEPGGQVALADLDKEDGDFHPPEAQGVYHAGFEREALAALMCAAGFEDISFRTACEVEKAGKRYPIFLVTARKPKA